MENKILLLVIENREFILREYAMWLSGVCISREIGGASFGDGKLRPIWYQRREAIRWALKNTDCTHILFVDTDVIPPPLFIKKLSSLNLPAISGYYTDIDGRVINRKDGKPYKGSGLEEVDCLSMGCSLWRRDVLEQVEYPEPNIIQADADMEFCQKVKEAGFKIYQNFNLPCDHILLKHFN